jgi:hypothetical protein
MGFVIDQKQKHKRQVLTEEKLDDIHARLEHTSRKSLKRLAQETEVSKSSTGMATQLPKLRPYEIAVIHTCLAALRSSWQGSFFAIGFYSLSSKVRSIHN